jgi:hypothetical protein
MEVSMSDSQGSTRPAAVVTRHVVLRGRDNALCGTRYCCGVFMAAVDLWM